MYNDENKNLWRSGLNRAWTSSYWIVISPIAAATKCEIGELSAIFICYEDALCHEIRRY